MSSAKPNYLKEKRIRDLLERIVKSLARNHPDDPAAHIVALLNPDVEASSRSHEPERWPTLSGRTLEQTPSYGGPLATGRRQSAISPSVLTSVGAVARRKAISSKMNSSTKVEFHEIPKDKATFSALEASIRKLDLLSFLEEEQRHMLIRAMFPKTFKNGDIIIREGDQPDNFYILNRGNCRVLKNIGGDERQVAYLNPGQYFGELALISGSTRAASVVADGEVMCWAIDQTTYLGLLKERHDQKRMLYRSLLRSLPFLDVLQDYEILLVADALTPLHAEKDDVIVTQGEFGDDFFIILEGQCIVHKRNEGEAEAHQVGVLQSGDYFGELALMKNTPRAATVTAGENCRLVRLDRQSFHRLLGPCIHIFLDRMKQYNPVE